MALLGKGELIQWYLSHFEWFDSGALQYCTHQNLQKHNHTTLRAGKSVFQIHKRNSAERYLSRSGREPKETWQSFTPEVITATEQVKVERTFPHSTTKHEETKKLLTFVWTILNNENLHFLLDQNKPVDFSHSNF